MKHKLNMSNTSNMNSQYPIIFYFLSLIPLCTSGETTILVDVFQGTIRGTVLEDQKGGNFYSFSKIPYAQKPINELRFKDPQPAGKWEGILNGVDELPYCVQLDVNQEVIGDEDCLYLNVYTPKLASSLPSSLLPVMVFIHGGGFIEGNGGLDWYSPHFLMPKSIVLVTINYRLGIFGFFNLQNTTLETPGNSGLKDQVMALKWVQDNIESFGGNKEAVTIFGQSAGGVSVHFHVLSPMSKGLFDKAILQSGTALCPWVFGLENNGVEVAKLLEVQTNDQDAMLKKLQNEMTTEDIMRGQKLLIEKNRMRWGLPVNPIIEPSHESAFITKSPYDVISNGEYNQVTLMIGYNDAEGIASDQLNRFLYGESKLISDFYTLVPGDLDIIGGSTVAKTVAKEIKEFYYGTEEPSVENMAPFIQIKTDACFGYPSFRTAMEHFKTAENPIYFYRFSSDTALNVYKRRDEISANYSGASHCDELGYLFKTYVTPDMYSSEDDEEEIAVDIMVTLWTNFAKYGNPMEKDTEQPVWSPLSKDAANYLEIGTLNLTAAINPDEKNMEFWNALYGKYFRSDSPKVHASMWLLIIFVIKLFY